MLTELFYTITSIGFLVLLAKSVELLADTYTPEVTERINYFNNLNSYSD